MRYAVETWDARQGAWVTLATFDTKQEARTRLWELRLPHGRVREVRAVSS